MLSGTLYQEEPGRISVRPTEKQTFHLFLDHPAISEGKNNSPLATPKATTSSQKVLGAAGAGRAWQPGHKVQSWHRDIAQDGPNPACVLWGRSHTVCTLGEVYCILCLCCQALARCALLPLQPCLLRPA